LISASSSPQFRVEQALKAFCTDGDDESENGGSLARPPARFLPSFVSPALRNQ
jgi:hypothetical protein